MLLTVADSKILEILRPDLKHAAVFILNVTSDFRGGRKKKQKQKKASLMITYRGCWLLRTRNFSSHEERHGKFTKLSTEVLVFAESLSSGEVSWFVSFDATKSPPFRQLEAPFRGDKYDFYCPIAPNVFNICWRGDGVNGAVDQYQWTQPLRRVEISDLQKQE